MTEGLPPVEDYDELAVAMGEDDGAREQERLERAVELLSKRTQPQGSPHGLAPVPLAILRRLRHLLRHRPTLVAELSVTWIMGGTGYSDRTMFRWLPVLEAHRYVKVDRHPGRPSTYALDPQRILEAASYGSAAVDERVNEHRAEAEGKTVGDPSYPRPRAPGDRELPPEEDGVPRWVYRQFGDRRKTFFELVREVVRCVVGDEVADGPPEGLAHYQRFVLSLWSGRGFVAPDVLLDEVRLVVTAAGECHDDVWQKVIRGQYKGRQIGRDYSRTVGRVLAAGRFRGRLEHARLHAAGTCSCAQHQPPADLFDGVGAQVELEQVRLRVSLPEGTRAADAWAEGCLALSRRVGPSVVARLFDGAIWLDEGPGRGALLLPHDAHLNELLSRADELVEATGLRLATGPPDRASP